MTWTTRETWNEDRSMPKPKEVFLLEVSYPEGRMNAYGLGDRGGGIFRTERDMKMRIATVKKRVARLKNPIPVKFKTYKLTANWEEYTCDSAIQS